jgi:hypothetical protein
MQAGQAAVVPGATPPLVRVLRPFRVIVVDHPVRTSIGGLDTGAPAATGSPAAP